MLSRRRPRFFASSTNGSTYQLRSMHIWHHRENDTDSEESSVVQESRIVRWRRESAHGNANLIIAGSMLFMVLVVVLLVFYLSHRSMKKRSTEFTQRRWLESDASLEVYTVDQFFDSAPSSSGPTQLRDEHVAVPTNSVLIQPPPSYEVAVLSSTSRNSSKIIHPISLFGVKPNCQCNRQQLLSIHQKYDLVKKCRQCRRIIRDVYDSDSEESGTEFCQCLLQNTVGQGPAEEMEYIQHAGDSVQTTSATALTNTTIPCNDLANGMLAECELDRCESEEVLDESGLPSYKTAAKLGLII